MGDKRRRIDTSSRMNGFFFFINLDIDDKYPDNSSASVFNRNIGCTCAYILFE